MNNANKAITAIRIAVYLIAIVGIGAWAWKNFGQPKSTVTASKSSETSDYVANQSNHVIVVTYFTSYQRCKTCLKIEKLTHAAITEGFADELASKEIIFQTINFDQRENKHFVKDYKLAFKTVVVSERKKGKEQKWSKYDKVWELHGDPEKFSAYLQEGIRGYLKTPESTPMSPVTQPSAQPSTPPTDA